MLEAIAVLLCCQLMGELIVVWLDLPLPGPVIGMAILFIGLVLYGRIPDNLASSTEGLLEQLSLLFVPAGVGVVTHMSLLGAQWLPLSASLIISCLVTIAITGWVMQWCLRWSQANDNNQSESGRD